MNAKIFTTKGSLPLTIEGNNLKAVNFDLKIPSAQIKSGLLLAALNTKGQTNITENKVTRDHTEVMLQSFGANIEINKIGSKKKRGRESISSFLHAITLYPISNK